jgi:PQQ-dependent dehydrogenase (methanol/ethanol family)
MIARVADPATKGEISMRGGLRLRILAVIATLIAVPVTGLAVAPESWPSFTQAQADAGKTIYAERCANCHGAQLEGVGTPALTGTPFLRHWAGGGKTVGDFYARMRDSMPLMAPHSLSDDDYTRLTAFILSRAGYRAGAEPLGPGNMATMLKPPPGAAHVAGGPRPSLPTTPAAPGKATSSGPDDAELAKGSDADWLMYNRVFSGTRYSALDQINRGNAARLEVKCLYQAGTAGIFETSPVVYGGMLYLTTAWTTAAIDPATCRQIWTHSYPADDSVFMTANRGVALYRGKLFRGTPDGHLIALDARTGKLLWDVWVADKEDGYFLSAAPVAYDGKVFTGEAGAEWGINAHVYAFDAETGRRIWTFNVIPTGKEVGASSWEKGSEHGGGAMWTSFAIQPDKGLLYVPVGNPAPDYNGAMRPGDNLFTNSVVALDMRSGKLAWYVQQTPHDTHDYDTAAAPILYDVNGKGYMAVATKAGLLHVYDRASRKEVARVAVTTIDNVDTPLTADGVHHCPGIIGGVEWNGPAFSPRQALLYTNAVDWCGTTRLVENRWIRGGLYFGGEFAFDPPSTAKGWTYAVDATTGKTAWSRQSATPMVAGLTPTAGDIIFTGDLDGNFLVLDSHSGKTLYSFNTGGGVAGGLSTYLAGGRQYVAAATGNNSRTVWRSAGAATIVVFGLAGN